MFVEHKENHRSENPVLGIHIFLFPIQSTIS